MRAKGGCHGRVVVESADRIIIHIGMGGDQSLDPIQGREAGVQCRVDLFSSAADPPHGVIVMRHNHRFDGHLSQTRHGTAMLGGIWDIGAPFAHTEDAVKLQTVAADQRPRAGIQQCRAVGGMAGDTDHAQASQQQLAILRREEIPLTVFFPKSDTLRCDTDIRKRLKQRGKSPRVVVMLMGDENIEFR